MTTVYALYTNEYSSLYNTWNVAYSCLPNVIGLRTARCSQTSEQHWNFIYRSSYLRRQLVLKNFEGYMKDMLHSLLRHSNTTRYHYSPDRQHATDIWVRYEFVNTYTPLRKESVKFATLFKNSNKNRNIPVNVLFTFTLHVINEHKYTIKIKWKTKWKLNEIKKTRSSANAKRTARPLQKY